MALSTSSVTEFYTGSTAGTWNLIPTGGGASAQNTNVFFSDTASRARKVSNTTKGYGFQINASGQDESGSVICVRWQVTAGVQLLDTRTNGGIALAVQDTSGNVSFWDLAGGDTYTGGWVVSVVDLGTTPSRNNGTAATLTAVEYIGVSFAFTATIGGGDPNTYIDQIVKWPQAGITITGNSTAFIDDLVDVVDLLNTGTDGGWGIFERRSGIQFSKARLILDPDATDFSETDRILVFENQVYDAGATIDSTLVEIGMESTNATAGELQTFTRCDFLSSEPDEAVTTDANREFDYTTADFCSFDTCKFAGFTGTVMHIGGTDNTYDDCTWITCSQIADTGAVVRRGFVRDTQAAATEASLLWTTTSDWQDTEFVMGASNSHAMEIETNITDAWTGFTFTGYNASAGPTSVGNEVLINNANGGVVTINASGVSGAISFRNNGTSTTTINNNVSVTFTPLITNTEVRIYTAGTSTELDGVENSGTSFTASVAASTSVDYVLHNNEYEYIRVEAFSWPTATATIPIQQRFDRNYSNPP